MIELISYENRPNTGPNTCGFEAFKAAANLPDLTLELFKLGKHQPDNNFELGDLIEAAVHFKINMIIVTKN